MAPTASKMSVVAQFDDFTRQLVPCSNIEMEFLNFVKNQEACRKQWHISEQLVQSLQKEVSELKAEKLELERLLEYTRNVLETEMARRERCEEEKEAKSRQIDLIKEFILNDPELRDETIDKLPFLRPSAANDEAARRLNTINESAGSALSPSRDSLDTSEDGCGRRSTRSRGKRSSGRLDLQEVEAKRQKSLESDDPARPNIIATTTVTVTDGKDFVATSRVYTQQTPHGISTEQYIPSAPPMTPQLENGQTTPLQQRHTNRTPSRTNSAGKLLSREHSFCTKTVIKPDQCGPCGKRITFYKPVLKCSRCRATCHPECKDKVPLPCIAVRSTPTQSNNGALKSRIADHAPPTSPMVPAIIVHCIQEVERRGLNEVGLYRVCGAEKEVRDIIAAFGRGKGAPNLETADIHAVCSAIKSFLNSLSETLITKSFWDDFVKAAERGRENEQFPIWHYVNALPKPNRDTLAALVLHLQLVAQSPNTKMPVSNLARVFGPTVVGYSSNDAASVRDPLKETGQQAQVMECLLSVPAEFWRTFIDVDPEEEDALRTPETKPVPHSSVLGPVYGTLGRKASRSRTPLRRSTGARSGYFSSPAMK
ncbi:rac GTPase-activating protein 1-like isoform X2 [Ornithodoros turicata]|uniref:rac GTPase-activating protein 1-like isoform X2 n=1 Tax=Ornithodoros turicata TaxID=34597 RepID=UPI003139E4F2